MMFEGGGTLVQSLPSHCLVVLLQKTSSEEKAHVQYLAELQKDMNKLQVLLDQGHQGAAWHAAVGEELQNLRDKLDEIEFN